MRGYSDSKDTNPKDGIGATKLPLSLVPPTALAVASLAHLEGSVKYGRWNWRVAGVRASIYLDAAMRHLGKWAEGEENDAESGVPHLGHALACINIIIDAQACGKLNDDRAPSVDAPEFLAKLTPMVKAIVERHAEKSPRHWSIADTGADQPTWHETRGLPPLEVIDAEAKRLFAAMERSGREAPPPPRVIVDEWADIARAVSKARVNVGCDACPDCDCPTTVERPPAPPNRFADGTPVPEVAEPGYLDCDAGCPCKREEPVAGLAGTIRHSPEPNPSVGLPGGRNTRRGER